MWFIRRRGGASSRPKLGAAWVDSPLFTQDRLALARFIAGIRALYALLAGIALLGWGRFSSPVLGVVVLPYLLLAAVLLLQTMRGWPRAGSWLWLWIDAAVLVGPATRFARCWKLDAGCSMPGGFERSAPAA